MKNRLTFSNVIGVLLENKKKTYQQHQLVRSMFSLELDDDEFAEITDADATKYSYWCSGTRPVPMEIIRSYDDEYSLDTMRDDFESKIIPNLVNESNARNQLEELITESVDVIGYDKSKEVTDITDNATFFAVVTQYAILNDHNNGTLYSPDLSEKILTNRLPSVIKEFTGRKNELKEANRLLNPNPILFVTGIQGIGKSEFSKEYASKYQKKYTNIIYLFYDGDLRKCIAGLSFADDTNEMTEAELFDKHYSQLRKLHQDSLVILDNFNVLPKDDGLMKDFMKNDFQLLVTTRCRLNIYETLDIRELDKEKNLTDLFLAYCPSAKEDMEAVSEIIDTVNCHTLTVCLAALSLSASGIEPSELLHELKTCGMNIDSGEEIEIYKDGDYEDGLMIEHLRKLLLLGNLSVAQLDILRNLSILPSSGVLKNPFGKWLNLPKLIDINYLIKYGFVQDDTKNKKISLHPLIQKIAYADTLPTMDSCATMINDLHMISLVHGLEVRRPANVIKALTSIVETIAVDNGAEYLLFLQDMFPYFEKYLANDYLPALVNRMEYTMNEYKIDTLCDKALLLDYKAELFMLKNDYGNALKKRQKAIDMIEKLHSKDADVRTASLLSNLYNNLSNTYLSLKKREEAATALHTAFMIRIEYAELGLVESHDMLQQMMNLTNMMILSKEFEKAEQILSMYENLIVEHVGCDTLDYGVCKLTAGIISLVQGKAQPAETNLLAAEAILTNIVGSDNDYVKTTHQYLRTLYLRWGNPELAEKYHDKLLEAAQSFNK